MAAFTTTPPGTCRGGSALARAVRPTITVPLDDRGEIEAAIETLIAWLDRTDGDPDLEPDGDAEPDDGEDDDRPAAMAFWPGAIPALNRCRRVRLGHGRGAVR